MVLFNYSTRELTAKVVYYGPGLCGKTTNLQFIHQNLPDDVRGKMLSLATKTDRTLFFDFLPIDLGSIRGMKTRVQLYTVPGQVFYNETRKLVLKGADGIVFVADSQETMVGANVESFRNLEDNLKGHGMSLADMPHVLQFNKRDLPRLSGIEELNTSLNKFNAPFYESVATTGIGVQDTLKAVVKLVLLHLTRKYDPTAQQPEAAPSATVSVPAPQVPAASPPPAAEPPKPVSPPRVAAIDRVGPDSATQAIPVSDFETPVDRAASSPEPTTEGPPPPPDFRGSGGSDVPPPPDFHGTGGAERETSAELHASDGESSAEAMDFPAGGATIGDSPEFGVEEIDELVDEVDEGGTGVSGSGGSEFDELPMAAAPADRSEDSMEIDTSRESMGNPSGPGLSVVGESDEPSVPPVAFASGLDSEGGMDRDAHGDGFGASEDDGFQVDRGFDPGWTASAPDASEADPSDVDVGPASLRDPSRIDAPSGDEPVLLTEIASDEDLFDDPDVEVAHLDGIEDREIVVPVEVGQGATKRRYKLSIRLHLDPVD